MIFLLFFVLLSELVAVRA